MQGFGGSRQGFAAGGPPAFQPPPMITNQPTGPNANEMGPTYSWDFRSTPAQPGRAASPGGGTGAGAGGGSGGADQFSNLPNPSGVNFPSAGTGPIPASDPLGPASTANRTMQQLSQLARTGQGPWPAITGGPLGDRNTVGPSLAQIQAYYSPQAVANRQGMANGTMPTWLTRIDQQLGVGQREANGAPLPPQMQAPTQQRPGMTIDRIGQDPTRIPMQGQGGGWLARGGRAGYDAGGQVPLPPWYIRRDAASETEPERGLINSAVPGRTDRHNVDVFAGSYVMPADVVSGLGEGNTLAGAKVLDRMMHTGPHGIALQGGGGGGHPPEPPSLAGAGGYRFAAAGGRQTGQRPRVPICVAGGEYLVHPDDVMKWGGGDIDKGHDNLDRFVGIVRKHIANKKLPGPKK